MSSNIETVLQTLYLYLPGHRVLYEVRTMFNTELQKLVFKFHSYIQNGPLFIVTLQHLILILTGSHDMN